MFIYTVFDKKAVSFGPLFIGENDDVAKRAVQVALGSDTLMSAAPADFSLYRLGEYDTNNGDISGISPVVLVCEVLSLIKIENNE